MMHGSDAHFGSSDSIRDNRRMCCPSRAGGCAVSQFPGEGGLVDALFHTFIRSEPSIKPNPPFPDQSNKSGIINLVLFIF